MENKSKDIKNWEVWCGDVQLANVRGFKPVIKLAKIQEFCDYDATVTDEGKQTPPDLPNGKILITNVTKDSFQTTYVPPESWEESIRKILDEAYSRNDLGEKWAVAELESLISQLLSTERERVVKEIIYGLEEVNGSFRVNDHKSPDSDCLQCKLDTHRINIFRKIDDLLKTLSSSDSEITPKE